MLWKQKKQAPPDVRALMKSATVAAANVLIGIMEDPDAKPENKIKCAAIILDRVLGKSGVGTGIGDAHSSVIQFVFDDEDRE